VEIAVISDTHMPRGPRRLPEACVTRLRAADLIVHAGDLATLPVLRQLEALGPVVAVHGNVDDAAVRAVLPGRTSVVTDGGPIGIIHDAGQARGRLGRLHRQFPGAAAVIFGHSHIPVHERADDGFQIFNPGSPTERRRWPHHTMGIATIAGGELSFELIELD
jgi:putative phosphoesterase